MTFNYRFSVIPAGAITDARLTPRALQVLCLLGRHTNDAGWCSRSQVKMARELGCGRSTIYDAASLLFECGWVERRANGRGGRAPIDGEQPFAAYSYRVLLDREVLPDRLKSDGESTPEEPKTPATPTANSPEGGAAQAAGGAGIAAGGAAMAAPLEGISSEGTYSEPERECAREHEERAKGLASFEARWPTAAADDRNKTTWAWAALSEQERDDALAYIGPFLEDLKRHKRTGIPAGWKYLEQKRWTLLARKAETAKVGAPESVPINSDQGRVLAVLHRIARMPRPLENKGCYLLLRPLLPQAMALLQAPPHEEWIFISESQINQCAAWNEFIGRELEGKSRPMLISDRNPGGHRGFLAPWPWPPLKDGSLCTGPPPLEVEDAEFIKRKQGLG